jgi:hypothetical protein
MPSDRSRLSARLERSNRDLEAALLKTMGGPFGALEMFVRANVAPVLAIARANVQAEVAIMPIMPIKAMIRDRGLRLRWQRQGERR